MLCSVQHVLRRTFPNKAFSVRLCSDIILLSEAEEPQRTETEQVFNHMSFELLPSWPCMLTISVCECVFLV